MLETGDWSARVRVARRLLAQAWLPTPAGWLAFRTPALPPLRLPQVRLPAVALPRLGRAFRWRPAFRIPRPRQAVAAAALIWLLAGVALFTVYLHMSRTDPANSDGASNALQAWAMLHGNPLLRGWQLSDVSFYTTELPQYALLELARGLAPDVVHIAAAMTYTLVVLLTAGLARGRATGAAGFLRAALAAGIMAAPQHSGGVYTLLLSPDHIGSTVPVLLTFILLDRAPRRWWVPAAAGLLLAWGLVADNVVLITGIVPLAATGAVRAYLAGMRHGGRLRAAVPELALVAAAAAALGAAQLADHLLAGAGGFYVWPVGNQLAAAGQLGGNLALTARGVLLLFGANFLGGNVSYAAALAALHLAGIGLVAWALASTGRRFGGAGRAEQLLAAATLLSLASYLLGTSALNLHSTREFAAVLPLGAALRQPGARGPAQRGPADPRAGRRRHRLPAQPDRDRDPARGARAGQPAGQLASGPAPDLRPERLLAGQRGHARDGRAGQRAPRGRRGHRAGPRQLGGPARLVRRGPAPGGLRGLVRDVAGQDGAGVDGQRAGHVRPARADFLRRVLHGADLQQEPAGRLAPVGAVAPLLSGSRRSDRAGRLSAPGLRPAAHRGS